MVGGDFNVATRPCKLISLGGGGVFVLFNSSIDGVKGISMGVEKRLTMLEDIEQLRMDEK